MTQNLTNWQRNVAIFKIDSVINWFYIPIGIWVLYFTRFLSFTEASLIYSVGLAFSTILELPSGALADLIGRKRTIMIGRFALFIGYLVLLMGQSFWHFLVYKLLYFMDIAMNSGAQSALIYDTLKENNQEQRYRRLEADTFMYCTLGMAIGSILGGFLFNLDIELPFRVMIFITFVGFITSCFYQEPTIDSEKFTLKNYLKQNWEGMKHIFAHARIRAVSFFSIIVTFITYVGLWYIYEPRLAEGNFDPRWLATLVAGTYMARALGTRLVHSLDKIIPANRTPIFLALLQLFGSALSFLTGKLGAISSVYTRKFSDGFRQPIVLTLQNEQMNSKYRATALSAVSLITNLLLAAVGPLVGFAIDHYSARIALGSLTVVGLFLAIPAALYLQRKMKE